MGGGISCKDSRCSVCNVQLLHIALPAERGSQQCALLPVFPVPCSSPPHQHVTFTLTSCNLAVPVAPPPPPPLPPSSPSLNTPHQVRPLEEAFKFGSFFSPLLNESDFEAKPSVLLLGQYSTGGWAAWVGTRC
jgi:hypothetical protein